MEKIIASPGRYIQGHGALADLCRHAGKLGKKMFIITSEKGRKRVDRIIEENAPAEGCEIIFASFNGECSKKEISRLKDSFLSSGSQVVTGIGGGKIHDTAKAVAYECGAPVVIVPTIASTDAPCSALSVIYTEEGVFEQYLFLPASPNLVLVDTGIVAAAPARLLVAGMGDALATWFEARACMHSEATNCVGGKTTLAAGKLAQLCYEVLLRDGYNAKTATEQKVCTKAVENIIEANTLLSGIGFESAGLAAAHAIHNGMTALKETHGMYHGEKVAFSTLVQLVLENASDDFDTAFSFCKKIGLPIAFEQLGIKQPSHDALMEVAHLACAEGDTMGNMPFSVTPRDVCDAMIAVDALGRCALGS